MPKKEQILKINEYYRQIKNLINELKDPIKYINNNQLNTIVLSDVSSILFKLKTSLNKVDREIKEHRLY